MNAMSEQAYASKLLTPETHERLVQNLPAISREANVPPNMIWTPMSQYCTEAEIEYVRGFKRHVLEGKYGLAFVGSPKSKQVSPNVNMKMLSIAGALLRNYIAAKVMTIQDVIQAQKLGTMPEPTALLIPNFFVGKKSGGSIAEWQVSGLLGLLYSRQAAGQQTIIYVHDVTALGEEYGVPIEQHIRGCFQQIKV